MRFVGKQYPYRPYFVEALKHDLGRFYGVGNTTGEAGYCLAVPVLDPAHPGGRPLGVIAIKAPLQGYEDALVNDCGLPTHRGHPVRQQACKASVGDHSRGHRID